MQFANQAIDGEIKGSGEAQLFASLTLTFADFNEPNVRSCLADGYQPTGAIAVFTNKGEAGATLLPTSDLHKHYCFRYSSQETYELQYATKPANGCKNIADSEWNEVPNDYVMLLVSAHRHVSSEAAAHGYLDYVMTSERLGKPGRPVGILQYAEEMRLSPSETQRLIDLNESLKLCTAMKLPPRDCGVH